METKIDGLVRARGVTISGDDFLPFLSSLRSADGQPTDSEQKAKQWRNLQSLISVPFLSVGARTMAVTGPPTSPSTQQEE